MASEASRGKIIAIYVTALSAGTALGPAILALVGREQALAFIIGAALTFFACLVLQVGRPGELQSIEESNGNLFRLVKAVPLAIAAAGLNAALEAASLTLLPIYAIQLGWSERSATLLLTVLLIGSILLQLPVGWFGDRVKRQKLVVVLAVVSAIGALVWPIALSNVWIAYPLLIIWGEHSLVSTRLLLPCWGTVLGGVSW
ncbi:MFS transporter [Ochrobactrum quorumnocens]|uniref:MFS transporter n=1 Tax=Ochrobactrum quorumnocens TaxID=271865 RepID=UPI000BA8CE3B|nr:MFS transporter [[Ochrobactrum] quorumnocens]